MQVKYVRSQNLTNLISMDKYVKIDFEARVGGGERNQSESGAM
jgi:hypothetical protein